MKLIFLIAFFALLVTGAGCNAVEQPPSTTFLINTQTPATSALKISNNSNNPITFKLKINDRLYYSNAELVNAVKAISNKAENQLLQLQTWHFFTKNIAFHSSVSPSGWQHEPLVLLNSLGFGQCDDLAFATQALWKTMGFNSRVWSLNGHVVPEVYAQNNWQLFDPSYAVYYCNQQNNIAGVTDLQNFANWVVSPNCIAPFNPNSNIRTQFFRYSTVVAKRYTSVSDNQIINSQTDDEYLLQGQAYTLPAGCSITFGVLSDTADLFRNPTSNITCAQAILTLPQGFKGSFTIPLILYSATGNGLVQYNNQPVSLPLQHRQIDYLKPPPLSVKVLTAKTPLRFIYFINPKMVKLQMQNTVQLIGKNCNLLEVTGKELPENLYLNQQINLPADTAAAARNYHFFTQNRQFCQHLTANLLCAADIENAITAFYQANNQIAPLQQLQLINHTQAALCRLLNTQNNNQLETKLVNICKNGHLEYFLTLLETNKAEQIINALGT